MCVWVWVLSFTANANAKLLYSPAGVKVQLLEFFTREQAAFLSGDTIHRGEQVYVKGASFVYSPQVNVSVSRPMAHSHSKKD